MGYPKPKTESYNASGGINTKASLYATADSEQLNILNMNSQAPGALTKRPGSTQFIGASVAGFIGGLFEFSRLTGASYVIATANTNAYTVQTGTFVALRSSLLNNGIFDFVPFVDRLFMANGRDFFKTDGVNTSLYSLPPGQSTASFGITAGVGGGLSGIVLAGYGYVNDRGYFGPPGPNVVGVTISLNGITFGSVLYTNMSVPADYGITAFQLYRSDIGQVFLFGTTEIPLTNGASFADNAPLTTTPAPTYLWFTLAPKYLELNNNQLFLAGFSNFLSFLYWSDIGEPEGVKPEFFAEVRTNDSDRITGLKAFQNSLMITKRRSTHRLSGDDPSNFALQQISDQFGCISNRAMVSYNDVVEWLDEKGIVQYNGANIMFTSYRVENIFKRMNVNAAIENACAIHNRQQNEIWWAIPIDGATMNNCVVVNDYLLNSWYVYQGFNPSSLAVAYSRFNTPTILSGGYTGNIFNFGASLFGDNGLGITCSVQTRFWAPMGHSVQQQFRRLFLDVNPINPAIYGITQGIQVNLRQDFGTSTILGFTMFQSPFQSRIEFGIPAKSMSAEFIHVSASLPFQINGWTIESRFQRAL